MKSFQAEHILTDIILQPEFSNDFQNEEFSYKVTNIYTDQTLVGCNKNEIK